MANNTILNLGSGGDTITDIDLANFGSFGYPTATGKLPACALYVSQAIGTIPSPLTTSNPLPVGLQGAIPAGANVIGHVICDSGSTTVLGAGSAAVGTVTTNADMTLTAGTAPSKALAVGGIYNTTAPAPTNGQTVGLQTNAAGALKVTGEGDKPTYTSCTGSFVPAASATDIAILPGSASKTVKVLKVIVTLSTSGTATIPPVLLIKRSTANSGGTSGAITVVPHDSANGAATAQPLSYTANPTTGTGVGNVGGRLEPTGTTTYQNEAVFDFTAPGMQPIVLRGVAQGLAVNLAGSTVAATAAACVTFVHTEE